MDSLNANGPVSTKPGQLQFIPQTDANLTDADLTGAIWNGVDLSGACLTGAALSGAHQLTQTQLDQAYGKPATCRRA